MTPQNKPKSAGIQPGKSDMMIRRATSEDVRVVAELITRTKRLNNEFDPMFAVVDDLKSRAEKYASGSIGKEDRLLLVAAEGSKVVGVIRAEMRERLFYEPSVEGFVTDFYILPEYRRSNLGNQILQRASAELKKMGAQIIVAEVPTQNEIAVRFYTKRKFRSLAQLFGGNP